MFLKILEKLGRKKIDSENIIDTLELAREKFPGSQISLDALCKRFRIDNSRRAKHTALLDCELLSKVYINLIDQKEPLLNFHVNEISEVNNEKNNIISLYPEIRIYNQPKILTSEADIISTAFFDKFMVINLLKGEEIFNVRYQTKPFMIWIWISTLLIIIGGLLSLFKRLYEK